MAEQPNRLIPAVGRHSETLVAANTDAPHQPGFLVLFNRHPRSCSSTSPMTIRLVAHRINRLKGVASVLLAYAVLSLEGGTPEIALQRQHERCQMVDLLCGQMRRLAVPVLAVVRSEHILHGRRRTVVKIRSRTPHLDQRRRVQSRSGVG